MSNHFLETLNIPAIKEHFALPRALPEAELPLQIFHTHQHVSIFDPIPSPHAQEEMIATREEEEEMKYLERIAQSTERGHPC